MPRVTDKPSRTKPSRTVTKARTQTRSTTSFHDARVALVVVAWAFLAFLPTLHNGFNFDDEPMFLQNTHYRGLAPENLSWMFTTFHMGHYQPLAWVSLAFDYMTWELDPRGYHLTSLILHAVNALLVFLLALHLIRRAGVTETPSRWGAAFAALLFAVHPLRVETVAWATERRQVLSTTFLLAATIAYLEAHAGRRPPGPRRWLIGSFVCFILALFTQALAVVFPAILILLDWYPLRRLRMTRAVVLEKIPFAAAAAAAAIWAPVAQHTTGAAVTLEQYPLHARLAQAAYGLVFYIWKTLAPFHLAPIYDIEPPVNFAQPKYLLSGIVVVLAAVFLARTSRNHRALAAAAVFYLFLLLPVLGFLQSGMQLVADRYSYLPIVGFTILAGGGVSLALSGTGGRHPRDSGKMPLVLAGVVVLGTLTFLTWKQTEVWKTPRSLWAHALEYHPGATAHHNYAGVIAMEGDRTGAIEHLEEAIRINPVHVEAYVNLGNLLGQEGEVERAADMYRQAIALQPRDFRARLELGNVLALMGDNTAAEAEYREAVAIRPASPEAHYNLGNLLVKMGRIEVAVDEYRMALAANPDNARIHWNLAGALGRLGRQEEAMRELEAVLREEPANMEARRILAAMRSPDSPSGAGAEDR